MKSKILAPDPTIRADLPALALMMLLTFRYKS